MSNASYLPFEPTGISVELITMVTNPAGDRFAIAKQSDHDDESKAYVTWAVGTDGSCFWGHYGLSFEEGMKDLSKRAGVALTA